MKHIKLIFFIAIMFILSINFAFAVDENGTDLTMNDDNEQILEVPIQEDAVALEENSDVLTQSEVQSIKMGEVTKRYNGAIEYKATFYDASGNPLKNTKVIFEVDDNKDYEATTDGNGVALLTVLISNGNHKIAALNPETINISTANIKVFDVIKGGKNINMYYDNGNTYKVRIFDNDGNPVKAGQKVTFKLNNKKYTRTTDKNGYAKFKITAKPGYYYITAQYKDFIVSNIVHVKDVIKANTGSLGKGLTPKTKVKIKFLGKNKKNKLIKVKFNKKTYKAKTNKKGIAVFKLKTPKKLGKYKLVASYKKSKVEYLYTQYRTS